MSTVPASHRPLCWCRRALVSLLLASACGRPLEAGFTPMSHEAEDGGVPAAPPSTNSEPTPGPSPMAEPPGKDWSLPIAPDVLTERLSRWLWNLPPPADLHARVVARVREPRHVEDIVLDMLFDPRALDGLKAFYRQWLSLDEIPALQKDHERFPYFDAALAHDLAVEAELFVTDATLSGPRGFERLLVFGDTFLNERLAAYHGQRFDLHDPEPYQRANVGRGLFSLGGILALTSPRERHSPARRGQYLRDRLLCEAIPSHPPGPRPSPAPGFSVRSWLETATAQPVCRPCHDLIDTVGFAFEPYDAAGRATDPRADDRWQLRFQSGVTNQGRGAEALARVLAGSRQARQCFAHKWLRWARPDAGEPPSQADERAVAAAVAALDETNGDILHMLATLATTDAWLSP